MALDQLGEGATCRVYAWGPDQVVKVFRRRFEYLAEIEHERATAVHRAGVPTPAVHGIVDVDGRRGLVFDRVEGPSLLDDVIARRRTRAEVGRTTAEVHVAAHDRRVTGLPQLADTLRERGVEGMPDGSAAFHGDFHPGNVLRHGESHVVIDWSNGHLAPPAADVACALLAMRYRGLRFDHPDVDRLLKARGAIADAYQAAYAAARPAVMDEVPRWFAAIGRLLLEQEPETAGANELRAMW